MEKTKEEKIRMFVPKSRKKEYEEYQQKVKKYRKVTKEDEGRTNANILVVNFVGHKPWDSFAGYQECKVDINKVGETFCDAYLVKERKPIRFKPETGLILIKR